MSQTVGRRSFLAAALALPLAGALSSCVGGDPAPAASAAGATGDAASGTVEFWTINLKKTYGDYVSKLISDFKAAHPNVDINWVDVPGADITTKLLAAVAGGTVPDLVNTTSYTSGLFAPSMSDLTKSVSADALKVFQPSLLAGLRDEEGRQYAAPWFSGGPMVSMWRKSVVEKAGFTLDKAPSTWDEMLEFAEQVYSETGIYGANTMCYSWVCQYYGVKLMNDDRTASAFNTDQTAEVFTKFKKYYDSKAIAPGVIGKDQRTYQQSLATGTIAFMPSLDLSWGGWPGLIGTACSYCSSGSYVG